MKHLDRDQAWARGQRPERVRVDKAIRARARERRRHMTGAERILWSRLRRKQLGHGFRRHYPIGFYIVDFVCFSRRLIVEVDDSQHTDQDALVRARSEWLESQGFRMLSFCSRDVLGETDGVLKVIVEALGYSQPRRVRVPANVPPRSGPAA